MFEPLSQRQPRGGSPTKNPFEGRWRWWYSAIADWMIRNPGGKISDCAIELKKGSNTISAIINTDMFQTYYVRRREEWQREHDYILRQKLTGVAISALDSVQENFTKKGDQVPMKLAAEIVTSSLDRLGFAPKNGPSVAVDLRTQNNVVQLNSSVTPQILEEARMALRMVEQSRIIGPGATEVQQLSSAIEAEVEPPTEELPAASPPAETLGDDGAHPEVDS
jgi:hypothetical protein